MSEPNLRELLETLIAQHKFREQWRFRYLPDSVWVYFWNRYVKQNPQGGKFNRYYSGPDSSPVGQ